MSNETPAKVASRPGSRWATGKRTKQKGYEQPKGFAKGCRVTNRTVQPSNTQSLEKQPK